MKTKTADSKNLRIPQNDNLLSTRKTSARFVKLWLKKLGYFSIFTALPAISTSFSREAQAGERQKPEMSAAGQSARILPKMNQNHGSRSSYLPPRQKGINDFISAFAGGDDCPGTLIPGRTYTVAAPFTDSGDTTGANNTVTRLDIPYWATYEASGPDQIYTFTLTGRGPNPRIQVTGTSANYNPMIYILVECPAGVGNTVYDWFNLSPTMNDLPLNVPLYLFVDSRLASSSGTYTFQMQDVTIAPAAPPKPKFDFDGDGKTDISVFRPADGFWHLNRSSQGVSSAQFGLSTDKLVPADYDGDGKTDIAVFRDGIWFLLRSTEGFGAFQFGQAGDIPQPADFDGDGRAELVVYREGFWHSHNLSNNQFGAVQFGNSTDKPLAADYDGDNRADYAVFREGIWYLLRSREGSAAIQFGLPTDKPVPSDYDGDGKTDVAVFRDGIWYLQQSSQGFATFQWGISTDIPVPADYNGDWRAEIAVYRNGIWYLLQSATGYTSQQFGLAEDMPLPSSFAP